MFPIVAGSFLALFILHNLPPVRLIRRRLRVRFAVGRTRPGRRFVLCGVTFADEGETTPPVEYVVVDRRGVWLVDTVRYKGRLDGSDERETWLQLLPRTRTPLSVTNPAFARRDRLNVVKKKLRRSGLAAVPVRLLVVFVEGNVRRVESEQAVPARALARALRRAPSDALSERQIDRVCECLAPSAGD